MCTTRSWKNIESQSGVGFASLIATRSDNVIIRVHVPIWPEHTPADIVDILINRLNSMKDCKCSSSAPCSIHLTNQGGLKNANS